jgi:hypothetical protein
MITECVRCGTDHYALKYQKTGNGPFRAIHQGGSLSSYTHPFVDSTGESRTKTYKRKQKRGGA